ncbi:hypothetical protein LOZ66_004434 [Ophidiomyces ophidiicola]|nr:hypothetical protein LOZ66_004434 [Ophidiomyces ophidiicola]
MSRAATLVLCIAIIALTTGATPTPTSTPSTLVPRDLVEPSNIPPGHNDTVICVYAISGQYGLLPRVLYYSSLVLGILGRYQRWLVMGALASALSYAGSTAIHMLAMLKSRTPVFDLDILAAWAVLTTGCLAFAGLVHWSSALRQSEARIVIVIWGVLIGMSCIVGRALLLDIHSDALPACRSPAGELLTTAAELASNQFNCTYTCFTAKTAMRQPDEIRVIPTERLLGTYANLGAILIGPVLAAAHKSVSYNLSPHTPSYVCTMMVMAYINSTLHMRLSQSTYNTACRTWYGGYILLFQYMRRAMFKGGLKRLLVALIVVPLLFLDLLFDILTPPLFIANIVFNELNLMKPNLPVEEDYSSVGQWSPVVSAALVLIASLINQYVGWFKAQRRAKKQQQQQQQQGHEENAQRAWGPSPPPLQPSSLADLGLQENGEVVQKLSAQETLQRLRVDSEVLKPSPKAVVRERTCM